MRIKRTFLALAVVLFGSLMLGSCDLFITTGNCNAAMVWPTNYYLSVNSNFATTSGFGTSEIIRGYYYPISSDSHYFYFYLSALGYVTSVPYYCSYTITPYAGSWNETISDANFVISLYTDGSSLIAQTKTGSSEPSFKVGDEIVPLNKEVTIQKNGYDMKIKISPAKLSDEELKAFIPIGK